MNKQTTIGPVSCLLYLILEFIIVACGLWRSHRQENVTSFFGSSWGGYILVTSSICLIRMQLSSAFHLVLDVFSFVWNEMFLTLRHFYSSFRWMKRKNRNVIRKIQASVSKHGKAHNLNCSNVPKLSQTRDSNSNI